VAYAMTLLIFKHTYCVSADKVVPRALSLCLGNVR